MTLSDARKIRPSSVSNTFLPNLYSHTTLFNFQLFFLLVGVTHRRFLCTYIGADMAGAISIFLANRLRNKKILGVPPSLSPHEPSSGQKSTELLLHHGPYPRSPSLMLFFCSSRYTFQASGSTEAADGLDWVSPVDRSGERP